MSLRIIGGFLKGRKITVPPSFSFRPTSETLRGAIFNRYQFQMQNIFFLDLFSGSGALGIEAISRGAAFVLFVEEDRKVAALIQKNLKNLNIEDKAKVLICNVMTSFSKIRGVFDMVTLDPPYDFSKERPQSISKIFQELAQRNIVKDKAVLFFEEGYSSSHLNKPPLFPSYVHVFSKKYGGALLHQYYMKK